MNGDERNDVYFKALAWAFLNPDRIGELTEIMKTWQQDLRKIGIFAAALTNAGSDQAQAALVELIDRSANNLNPLGHRNLPPLSKR